MERPGARTDAVVKPKETRSGSTSAEVKETVAGKIVDGQGECPGSKCRRGGPGRTRRRATRQEVNSRTQSGPTTPSNNHRESSPRLRRILLADRPGWTARPCSLGVVVAAAGVGRVGRLAAASAPHPAVVRIRHGRSRRRPSKVRRGGGQRVVVVPREMRRARWASAPRWSAVTSRAALPPFQGTLALDNDTLPASTRGSPARSSNSGRTTAGRARAPANRPPTLRVGDARREGQLLAVVWSKDLGEKKSELVDAVSKLRADEKTLERLEGCPSPGTSNATSCRPGRAGRRDRPGRRRAGPSGRCGRGGSPTPRSPPSGRGRPAEPAGGARDRRRRLGAASRCGHPQDGVDPGEERAVGDIVDTTTDLFKIGDLTHLAVWAHVYEEDLPDSSALPKPTPWV